MQLNIALLLSFITGAACGIFFAENFLAGTFLWCWVALVVVGASCAFLGLSEAMIEKENRIEQRMICTLFLLGTLAGGQSLYLGLAGLLNYIMFVHRGPALKKRLQWLFRKCNLL